MTERKDNTKNLEQRLNLCMKYSFARTTNFFHQLDFLFPS